MRRAKNLCGYKGSCLHQCHVTAYVTRLMDCCADDTSVSKSRDSILSKTKLILCVFLGIEILKKFLYLLITPRMSTGRDGTVSDCI